MGILLVGRMKTLLKGHFFVCITSTVNPKFNIKLAVAKNYDDLFPIVENAQKKGALLSKIPDSAIPAQPYSLARFIAAQDKNNRVLIAEVFKILFLLFV